MSKKTVSVLLLLILTLAVAIFSFTSCKNDPAPTAAPRAGEIPSIPNNQTKINSLGVTQKDTLSTLFNDVAEFFVSYADTYGLDNSDEPLYDLTNCPEFSFEKEAILSASASEGTFRGQPYSHEEITGSIGIHEKAESFCIFADTTVTADELFGWNAEKIHIEYDLAGNKWINIFIGEKENYGTPDIRFESDGDVYANYVNESSIALPYGEQKDECKRKADFLLFLGYKALSDATIDLENVVLNDTSDENPTSFASFTINGQIKLSGTLKNVTDFDASDFDEFDIEDLFSSFSASVESLSIQATVATDATTSEGKQSEILAATLSVKNLSLSAQYETAGEPEVSTLKCDKLSLSLSNSDADVVFSLELSDADFAMTFDMGLEDLEGSATIGLGAKAGENSVGLLTDFEFTMGSFTGLPYVTFTPKAAVINGAFYSTKDAKDLLIEYCDMLVAFLRQRAYA